ncbi:MAG: cytochrome P450, partial [Verrucomicrobia bacterium]|nr:cytochrome P450 [Verrucomicrobiota bacterium]
MSHGPRSSSRPIECGLTTMCRVTPLLADSPIEKHAALASWVRSMIRLCLFLLATVIHGEVTNVRPIRVAILVDGRHDLVVALIEQVEVRLSRLTDVAMLDRSSLNQVLAEHALSVSGLLNRDQAVEAGRLLGADVLILATDRKEYLSWRIIDVSTGFLLGLHILPQPVSPDEAEAASVAGEIAKGLAKARLPRDKTLLISVARFINRDVTREYDALQTVLPELMSRILSDVPNMILLEREDLVRLDQEKAWEGADLQGYEEGMLLIEGDYRTDRRAGHHRLETHVLVRTRTGEQVAEVRVKGEAEDPLTLVRDLVSALLRRLNLGAGPEAELGAGREARRFMMKAAFFRDQQDFLSAADMTETAFYLEPDNPVYRERVIRARQDVMRGYINWSADPREIARRLGYFIRAVEDGRRLLENNDPLLEKIGDDRLYHSAVFGRGCWASEQKELLRQARTAYLDAWSAHRRWLRQRLVDSGCDEKWQRRYRDAIHLHMRAFLNDELFDRPDDIRKHLRMLLEDVVWLDEACAAPVGRPMPHTADFLPELLSSIGYPYEKPESPAWDALKAVREEVLEEWAADTRPWIGFYAKVALAAYRSRVKEDLVVGRRMAEEAIRELTRYDVSLNDWVYSDICFAVTGESGFWDLSAVVMAIRNVTQRDPALHSRALDGLVSRVCNLLLAKIASQPHFEEWSDIVLQHLSRSLAEGEEAYVRQMVTSLMDYTVSARASEGDE